MPWKGSFFVYLTLVLFESRSSDGIFLVIPEDVATGFAAIYGFSPKIVKGNDHRFGFGFRLGNHADFQILYEIGPQISTGPIQPRIRSATYRERLQRPRPVLEFLIRTGFIKEAKYRFNYDIDDDEQDYEPR